MSGPQRNSGRKPGDPLTTRTEPVRIMVRPGEREDLGTLAEAWGCPLSTAAWAILSTELARIRGTRVDLGPLDLQIRATARVLSRASIGGPATVVNEAERALDAAQERVEAAEVGPDGLPASGPGHESPNA